MRRGLGLIVSLEDLLRDRGSVTCIRELSLGFQVRVGGEKDMLVTIDGPSGAGKTTVSRLLARRLGFRYVDTGALYRTVALLVIREGVDPSDQRALEDLCERLSLKVCWEGEDMHVFLGEEDVTSLIRSEEIGILASKISALPPVRKALFGIQRRLAEEGDMVFEGRDMGSVVFPEADVKFFLTADPKERARRRHRELVEAGRNIPLSQVEDEILKRDQRDSQRILAPLKVPEGAIHVDSTGLTIEQVVEKMLQMINRRDLKDTLLRTC